MGPRSIEDYAGDAVGILVEARAALGRSSRVTTWMNARQPALANQVPAEMLSSAEGAEAVRRELQRIQNFRNQAKEIVRELRQLDSDRLGAALRALDALESFAPQLAKATIQAFQGREGAARWLAGRFGTRDTKMPWEALADWDLESLYQTINATAPV